MWRLALIGCLIMFSCGEDDGCSPEWELIVENGTGCTEEDTDEANGGLIFGIQVHDEEGILVAIDWFNFTDRTKTLTIEVDRFPPPYTVRIGDFADNCEIPETFIDVMIDSSCDDSRVIVVE